MKRRTENRPAARRMNPWRTSGFTYYELVMIMLLLGIFAMQGLPALNTAMGDARLSGAAQEVVNAMEFAQISASAGHKTQVVIEASQDRITVKQYLAYEFMGNPMNKGTDYLIDFPDGSRFLGVDITASDFNAGDPVIFDMLGAPSKGGSVTLALGGRQMVVTLDALTGKVSVSQ